MHIGFSSQSSGCLLFTLWWWAVSSWGGTVNLGLASPEQWESYANPMSPSFALSGMDEEMEAEMEGILTGEKESKWKEMKGRKRKKSRAKEGRVGVGSDLTFSCCCNLTPTLFLPIPSLCPDSSSTVLRAYPKLDHRRPFAQGISATQFASPFIFPIQVLFSSVSFLKAHPPYSGENLSFSSHAVLSLSLLS